MSAESLSDVNCAVAQTLNLVGELWTLMVLRNIFNGMYTFDELQNHLGLSSSVLSARLAKLTDARILEKRQSIADRRSFEYRLTTRGRDLYPILIALNEWGEKWVPGRRGKRLILLEKSTGEPIAGVRVLSGAGRALKPTEVEAVPGPAADPKIRALVGARNEA